MPPIPYLSIGAALASAVFGHIGAQQQRKQAIKDQDNQFVRMRNAAQRAGFNPLTVLRATGGQGFTALPTISKAAAFGNAALGVFDAFKNAPIEKYQRQVRDLTLKGMKADLANTLANTRYTGMLSKRMAAELAGVKNTGNVKSGIINVADRAAATTDEGVALPNDPQVPTGYTVPKEVMEQFPVQIGALSLDASPMSAAAVVEEQYGDALSWVYGFGKVFADVYTTGILSAHEAGAQGFNNPARAQMLKNRLKKPVLIRNVVTPFSNEAWFSPHK